MTDVSSIRKISAHDKVLYIMVRETRQSGFTWEPAWVYVGENPIGRPISHPNRSDQIRSSVYTKKKDATKVLTLIN